MNVQRSLRVAIVVVVDVLGCRLCCSFLREAINCKDALITSQCGSETGQFAYHLLRLSNDDFVVKNRCHLPRNPTYKGVYLRINDVVIVSKYTICGLFSSFEDAINCKP